MGESRENRIMHQSDKYNFPSEVTFSKSHEEEIRTHRAKIAAKIEDCREGNVLGFAFLKRVPKWYLLEFFKVNQDEYQIWEDRYNALGGSEAEDKSIGASA